MFQFFVEAIEKIVGEQTVERLSEPGVGDAIDVDVDRFEDRLVQVPSCLLVGSGDPLWRARRRLSMAEERLAADQHDRLMGLLRAGDPHQEVWFAWNAKGVVRQIYDHTNVELALEWIAEIGRDFTDPAMPTEVRRLGRTIRRWAAQIVAWHRSHVTNGPTEAVNNLAKRIKRVAFGLVNFRHHRVRCLLYAGKPDWTLLPTIQP